MALTNAEIAATTRRIAELKAARASGALIVRHGDTTVQYRSLSEIDKILGSLEDSLVPVTTARTRLKYLFQSGKGL
jgi:hypothetical protein